MDTLKLLVVDDDAMLCKNLADFFKRENYQVSTANDGPSALQAIDNFHPHLVFLDIGLPGISGIEVLKQIKLKDPSVRVIMITGQTEEEFQRQAKVLGADDFVCKPFSAESLRNDVLEKLKRHLWHELCATSYDLVLEKEKLQLLFHNTREGILLLDKQGLMITANPSAVNLLGLPKNTGGLNIQEVFSTFTTEDSGDILASEKGRDWVRGKPKKLILESTVNAISDVRNERAGYLVTVRDVTQERLKENAQHHFISFISHKLRTPLVFIRTFPGICRQGLFGPLDEHQKDLVDRLDRNSCQMEDMVNQLIAFISLNPEQIVRRPVSVGELLQEAERKLPSDIMARKSQIQRSAEIGELVVDVDATLVSYAFRNLIENAFKFKANSMLIYSQDPNGFVTIAFKDDGVGIPSEDVEKVFDPFYQVEKDFTGQVAGPGLGLTVVKRVVESHGGRAWVESAPGKGSTFFVKLPTKGG